MRNFLLLTTLCLMTALAAAQTPPPPPEPTPYVGVSSDSPEAKQLYKNFNSNNLPSAQQQPPPPTQILGPDPGQSSNSAPTTTPAPYQNEIIALPIVNEKAIRVDYTKKRLIAIVSTTMGRFKIRLLSEFAPKTVQNFVELASGKKQFIDAKTSRKSTRPFYNDLIFHKVIPGFVIQTGCPLGTGQSGPGYTIPDEITPYIRHSRAGIVSMANSGPNTGGSQFFITLAAHPEFDGKYSAFGEVISGLEVVKKISLVKAGPTGKPIKRVLIKTIEIEER